MKAVGQFAEGAAGYEAGKFTRSVMRTNSANALRDGAAEASSVRDNARQAIGRQLAGLASSGFTPDSGSALDALRESAIEAELDVMTVRRRASQAAMGYQSQGQIAYAQGVNAQTAGVLAGAQSIAEDAAKYGGG